MYILRAASHVPLYCQGARKPSVVDLRLCDMSRVLITQMGLVAMVEHAPAVIEAYPLDNHQLSGDKRVSKIPKAREDN